MWRRENQAIKNDVVYMQGANNIVFLQPRAANSRPKRGKKKEGLFQTLKFSYTSVCALDLYDK